MPLQASSSEVLAPWAVRGWEWVGLSEKLEELGGLVVRLCVSYVVCVRVDAYVPTVGEQALAAGH